MAAVGGLRGFRTQELGGCRSVLTTSEKVDRLKDQRLLLDPCERGGPRADGCPPDEYGRDRQVQGVMEETREWKELWEPVPGRRA